MNQHVRKVEELVGPYDVGTCDFPWKFSGGTKGRPQHYTRMTVAEGIEWGAKTRHLWQADAALFFWITGPHLVIGSHIPIMKAMGFKPTAMGFVWIKLTKSAGKLFFMPQDLHVGQGLTTLKNAEFCIIGKRGKSLRVAKDVKEVIIDNVREHSRKPDVFRDLVDKYVGPGRRTVELFSRSGHYGWDSMGEEFDKFKSPRGLKIGD